MTMKLRERIEVLRDEALNTAEFGPDAPGSEIFDAIVGRMDVRSETDAGLDMTLADSIRRRLAWGEDPTTVIVDCDSICKRLIGAAQRSFPDPEEATQVIQVVTGVACSVARLISRLAVQRASQERGLQRRELMVQRQLRSALEELEQPSSRARW